MAVLYLCSGGQPENVYVGRGSRDNQAPSSTLKFQ